MVFGGECASQVWSSSGSQCLQRYVLLLDIAFGLQLRPHVLRNGFIDWLYTIDNNQVVYNLPSRCSSNLHAHSGLHSTFYK